MDILNNLVHLPKIGVGGFIEIVLLAVTMYYITKTLRGTRAWILLKGVFVMVIAYAIAYILQFNVIVLLFQNMLLFIGIVVIMVLQPEIRRIIEQIGTNNINLPFSKIVGIIKNRHQKEIVKLISDQSLQEIVKGCSVMGKAKTGALIVIENEIPLNEYIETGISVNADITAQLLINIFEHNTPLHDGAIIIRKNKIMSATCYLPLSDNREINKDLGTRHRAAIGITEVSDAIVVVVSEETGAISVASEGRLIHNIDREGLTEELKKVQNKYSKSIEKKHSASILDDTPLKAATLLATLILWFVVISAVNPVVTTTIRSVPITLLNTESIAEIGKTYEIVSDDTVNVTVKGRKFSLDNITKEDIKITADLSELSVVNAVQLNAEVSGIPDAEITLSEPTLKISMEDIVDTEFNIEVNQIEAPSNLYYISNIDLNTDTLVISGAKSLVNKIGRVQVDIDASDITSSSIVSLKPVIYDRNGELMDINKFSLNYDNIEASISLYNTKSVPLNINAKVGNEQITYIIKDITYENKQIYVAGTQEALNSCNSIDIDLQLDIALEDISKSQFIKNIEIRDYLPEGIYVANQYSKESLTVDFKDFHIKTFNIKSYDISVDGVSNNHIASIEDKSYKISLISLTKDISSLELSNTQPFVNATGLGNGEHQLKVQFKQLPEGVFTYGDNSVNLSIKNKE